MDSAGCRRGPQNIECQPIKRFGTNCSQTDFLFQVKYAILLEVARGSGNSNLGLDVRSHRRYLGQRRL
jgi:hypothetical protein